MMARVGMGHLMRRQLWTDLGAAVTVLVVVFLVALGLAAGPRALDRIFTDELREQVTGQNPRFGDMSGQVSLWLPHPQSPDPNTVTVDELYGTFDQTLAEIGEQAPEIVRGILGEPAYYLLSDVSAMVEHIPPAIRDTNLSFLADPQYAEAVELVEGELPAGFAYGEADPSAPVIDERFDQRARIVDVAVSVATAERLEWPVGQERALAPDPHGWSPPIVARLSGIFEPADPDAGYWEHTASTLVPFEEHDPDYGVTVFARGFVAPHVLSYLVPEALAFVRFPVDGSALTAKEGPALLDELRNFSASTYRVSMEPETLERVPLRFTGQTIDTVDSTISQQSSASALIALVAVGPFGVALAVIALGSMLVIERRRRGMSLLAARGASTRQIQVLLAIEGALLGIPAAVLAVVVAQWATSGDGGWLSVIAPLAVGLAPMILLPLIAKPGRLRAVRADLGKTRRRWVRDVADVLVIWVAAAAVFVLNQRGLVAGSGQSGVDPLLVATPLLVALAACVVVLRLFPVPVTALSRLFKRRNGIVGFVGSVRAVRDPAAGCILVYPTGEMVFTRIPCSAPSIARMRINPTTAHLAAA
jgi:putative ABC transport system permease protein